jgi:hypothetical protein
MATVEAVLKSAEDADKKAAERLPVGEEMVGERTGATYRRVAPRTVSESTAPSPDEMGTRAAWIDEGIRRVSDFAANIVEAAMAEARRSEAESAAITTESARQHTSSLLDAFNALPAEKQAEILWEIDPYDGCFGDVGNLSMPEDELRPYLEVIS